MSEEENKGRGTECAPSIRNEKPTINTESLNHWEQQQYAREREEEIEIQQSEPYPLPMSEPDPPT